MSPEQRRLRRVACDVKIYFGTRGADHLGIVQDVSENSMRVRARKAFPVNSTLQMKVEVPGQGMVAAKGVVKRLRKVQPSLPPHEPMEMGVIIVETNKHLKEMIGKLLNQFHDKRISWRKEIQLPATTGKIQHLINEYTQNIGVGGIFVVTENPAKPGEVLETRIVLPKPYGEVRAQCEVVHSVSVENASRYGRLPGCGFRFLSFSEGDEKKYLEYLKTLAGGET